MINKKIETVNPIQSTLSSEDDVFTALSTSALLAKSAVPYSHRRIADNYVIIKRVYRFQAVQSRITNAELQLLKKYDFISCLVTFSASTLIYKSASDKALPSIPQ